MFAEECCLGEVDIHVRIIFSIPRPRIINAVEIFSTQKLTNKHLIAISTMILARKLWKATKKLYLAKKSSGSRAPTNLLELQGFTRMG